MRNEVIDWIAMTGILLAAILATVVVSGIIIFLYILVIYIAGATFSPFTCLVIILAGGYYQFSYYISAITYKTPEEHYKEEFIHENVS